MRYFTYGLLLILVTLVTACGAKTSPASLYFITGNTQTQLMPVNMFIGNITLTQNLESTYGDTKQTVTSVVKLSNDGMLIIAFSGMSRLFTINYQNTSMLKAEFSPLLPSKLQAEYIVSDIQLIYYPASAINQSLPSDLHMVEQHNDVGMTREFFNGATKIIEINYSANELYAKNISFKNLERSYTYNIHTLEIKDESTSSGAQYLKSMESEIKNVAL